MHKAPPDNPPGPSPEELGQSWCEYIPGRRLLPERRRGAEAAEAVPRPAPPAEATGTGC
jgi:hypothetical protein